MSLAAPFVAMSWLNDPPQWSVDGDVLRVVTGSNTDFWRNTFYGFTRDSGHFLHTEVSGDFTAEVTISGEFEALYDQSGLMVRVDAANWLKTGVEFTDGAMHLSTVVTRGFSDWSMAPVTASDGRLSLRVTRHDTALRVQYRDDAGGWPLLRLGYLPMTETVQVGVMCCSPERAGFAATFTDFGVGVPIGRDLHG